MDISTNSRSTNGTSTKKRKVEEEKRVFKERWTEDYFFVNNSDKKPLCLICNKSVSYAKEYNVKRHYSTNHPDYHKLEGNERKQKLKTLQRQLSNQRLMFQNMRSDNEKSVRCSFLIAQKIAERMKPYSEGHFVKECLMSAAQEMCPKMVTELEKISLSRWTVARRIDELADDSCVTLREKVKNFVSWSFAVDEFTDQTDTAQLAIFVKGVDIELNVTEELLSLQPIKDTTTGADIYSEVQDAFEKFGMDLSTLCEIATDGARAMSGAGIGLVGLLKSALREKKLSDNIAVFHCIIHQQNLCAKTLNYKHVFGPVIKAVNFIRARGLNHRQFQKFLNDLNSAHQDLLYFTDVRWLSKGRMIKRFYNLREEVVQFLKKKGQPMHEMEDESWICDLAFLVDITKHLNDLNTKLQRNGQFASEMYGHIKAFQCKLRLWQFQMQGGNLCHFQTLSLRNSGIYRDKKTKYVEQLQSLMNEFFTRFKDFGSHEHLFEIFSSPFDTDVTKAPADIQMELIDLQANNDLKAKYKGMNLGDFYRTHIDQDKFPLLQKFVASKMALFGSTYVCEQFFSKLGFMKSPHRSVLTDEHVKNGLRVLAFQLK